MRTPTNLRPRNDTDLLNGLMGEPPTKPSPPSRPPRNPSAFIPGKALDRSRPSVVRWSSLALLPISLLCTIVAFHGGSWASLRTPSVPLVLAAVALQVWCTAFEWMNRRRKLSFWYVQAFILDVVPSTYSFGPIIAFLCGVLMPAPLALWLSSIDLRVINGYTAFVWLLAFGSAWQLARIPEDRLIAE